MTNTPSNKMIPTNTDWTNLWDDPQTEIDLSKLKDTNKSPMDIHETIRVYLANRFGFKDPDEFDTAIDNSFAKFMTKNGTKILTKLKPLGTKTLYNRVHVILCTKLQGDLKNSLMRRQKYFARNNLKLNQHGSLHYLN